MSGEEFANFVRQNEAGFYRIAYSYVRSREDALDIVQDAVEKGLRKLPALRDPARIKPWFCRILVNESIDRIRRRRETEPADESRKMKDLLIFLKLFNISTCTDDHQVSFIL